jgi:hypothetical protein
VRGLRLDERLQLTAGDRSLICLISLIGIEDR